MESSVAEPVLTPWRPVQFLGSKVRSLDFISDALRSVQGAPGTVWDAFSGSSVVSQRLGADRNQVWASDALRSSAGFGAALLGVRRRPGEVGDLVGLARKVVEEASRMDSSPWDAWLKRERSLVAADDGPGLLAIGGLLPQRWRSSGTTPSLDRLFGAAEDSARSRTGRSEGLLSTVYAGTYFGIEQSLALDGLRGAIDAVAPSSDPDMSWSRAALLTALCHAASAAVFSPGKHFAQPHRIRVDKDLSFHGRRAAQDRRVHIPSVVLHAAEKIDRIAANLAGGHRAERRRVGETAASLLRERGVTAVYADPPYTAQQYSRFYHLLETLVSGVPPVLQLVNGEVTRGLYPADRFLSPFSSRRGAPAAFQQLVGTTHSVGAHILISYSASRGAAIGNARIVSLEQIVEWVRDAYGVAAVSVEELQFRYRQFNNAGYMVEGRDDPEYLVIGRARAR